MKDYIEKIMDYAREIAFYDSITMTDIPDIALYMDQVTTLMEKKLKPYKRHEEDKLLTKTMINNYTKSLLVSPPDNKKYNREHIMLLVILYHLKQVMTMNDIALLLKPVISLDEQGREQAEDAVRSLYEGFLQLDMDQKTGFEESVETLLRSLSRTDSDTRPRELEMILCVVSLIIQAEKQKLLAEKILDAYFTDVPVQQKKKEKEKK